MNETWFNSFKDNALFSFYQPHHEIEFNGLGTSIEKNLENYINHFLKPFFSPNETKETPFKNLEDNQEERLIESLNAYFHLIEEFYNLNCEGIREWVKNLPLKGNDKSTINFLIEQILEALSPSNFPHTNPNVVKETLKTKGENLRKGFENFLENHIKKNNFIPSYTEKSSFKIGENIAPTEGAIIFENEFFQLIEYKPLISENYSVPLLIIPPWINRFYIFDINKEKSFIRWNLERGRKVYTLSWANADPTYKDFSFEDFIIKGVLKSIHVIRSLYGKDKINLLGFCVSGVALACLLSYLKQEGIFIVSSATFLATPFNFHDLSNMKTFVNEKNIDYLELTLNKMGIMPGQHMEAMFSQLRPKDLIWANYINNYLLAKSPKPHEFLFWNSEATNIPATMHLEYLKEFFLKNGLIEKSDYKIGSRPINIEIIDTPSFIVATKKDHIVPWTSSFYGTKMMRNASFILGDSGHIAGIVNHPAQKKYCYWKNNTLDDDTEIWLKKAEKTEGSWWIEWDEWLKKFDGIKEKSFFAPSENIIEMAPGRYCKSK